MEEWARVASQSVYGPIWTVALTSGMRRSEVLGLRREDVDFERQVLHVRQVVTVVRGAAHIGVPKSKSSRREIAIPGEAITALREQQRQQEGQRSALGAAWREHGLVFTAATGNPINPNNLTCDFKRLVRSAGLPLIRIHDLRHGHVALLIQWGADIKAVSERVGHTRTSTTIDIYHYVMPEQCSEAVAKISGALSGEPSPVVG